MGIRKNVRNLNATERAAFVAALLEFKRRGEYDGLVQDHVDAMAAGTPPVGARFGPVPNAAHRGPAFLPWHREYLIRLERSLQDIDPDVSLPYWDWTQDSQDPAASPIWADDFMGGNGVESEEWRVMNGPFARQAGNWILSVEADQHGDALRRRFGRLEWPLPDGTTGGSDWTLPTSDDVKLADAERHYDAHPFDDSPFTTGFRNRLEGWIQRNADPNVKTEGSQLHNRVHVFVGGAWVATGPDGNPRMALGSMLPGSSPNDPVFFLHHCFIDKLWADWQRVRAAADPAGRPHYAPLSGGPFGQNLHDPMYPWRRNHTPYSVLDHRGLGYEYDTDTEEGTMPALASRVEETSRPEPPPVTPYL